MTRRVRLWIVVGAIGVVAISYFVRPEDDVARVMQFRPSVSRVTIGQSAGANGTRLDFRQPSLLVARSLPGKRLGDTSAASTDIWTEEMDKEWDPPKPGFMDATIKVTEIELPSGQTAELVDFQGSDFGANGRCALIVCDDTRPWYRRAWSTAMYRLGLR